MKKKILNFLVIIYAVIAVFITVCLLSYNQYRVTEFGEYSFLIVNDDTLEPDYNKGDLIITDGSGVKKIEVGEEVFFYQTYGTQVNISKAKVEKVEVVTPVQSTFTLEGDYVTSTDYIIASTDDVTVIPSLGKVLGVLESKWGFLFLIVFPSLIAFLYEITVVFSELKGSKKEK